MRSSSFARVVMASLGVSVVITPGCGKSPGEPSGPFSVLSISPTEGTSAGNTPVVISGTGFIIRGQGGATVTVDGSPVNASPSPDGNTIRFVMPAHAVGKVDVNVTAPLSQVQASVPGGYTYVLPPPPVISELLPNTGSTAGGAPIIIKGSNFWGPGLTVTVGGIVTPFEEGIAHELYLLTPAHAAGTVEVIVTSDGRTASATFTYASPATFDFNGDWQGFAGNLAVVLAIRDNIVVSASCGASILTLAPAPVVANGEFSFAGSGGVSITGQILSPDFASGSINMASCVGSLGFSRKK